MILKDILKKEPKEQVSILCVSNETFENSIETWKNEFDGAHKIKNDLDRKPRTVGTGDKARLVVPTIETVPFQKKIVNTAVAFMFGKPLKLILANKDTETYGEAFDALKNVWKEKKLDYFNRLLMRTVSKETRAAELWTLSKEEGGPYKYYVQLLCSETGDELFPHYDAAGDMDAFVRRYKAVNKDNKEIDVVEIRTSEVTRTLQCLSGNQWSLLTDKENIFGKIPVVYYEQAVPEWYDVQSMIDRMEKMVSKTADTNDYFSGPVLKTWGQIKKMPEKEQDGKHLAFESEESEEDGFKKRGDAEYLTWDQSPESLKTEYEILKELIYSMSHTPDISFDNVKGIGQVSGIALTLMFLDPLVKAMNKEEIYGAGMLRRISILKSMMGKADVSQEKIFDELDVDIEFQSILPQNISEVIQNLVLATAGEPIISQESAVKQNPLVQDPAAEVEILKEQQASKPVLFGADSFE